MSLLREIHYAKQRMPLIRPPEAVDTWLTGTPEQATGLLVPYPSELMCAHRVSKRVNKPENDEPELMAPVELETEQQACSSISLSTVAAAQTREIPGFQVARSPPRLPATASWPRATGPISDSPMVGRFPPARPPIVRGS